MKYIKLFEQYNLINESLDINKAKELLAGLATQYKFKLMVDKNYTLSNVQKIIKDNGLKGVTGCIFLNGSMVKGEMNGWTGKPNEKSSLQFIIISPDMGMLKSFYNTVMKKIESIYDKSDPMTKEIINSIQRDRKDRNNFTKLATNVEGLDSAHNDKGTNKEEVQKMREEQGGQSYYRSTVNFY
jgi:hypothetical protein